MRIIMPSLEGFSPRLLAWMAFSMAPMAERSKGLTVSRRGSGTATAASCFSGVAAP